MLTVRVNDHGLTSHLQGVAAKLRRPGGLMAVLGREARNRLVGHFRGNDRTGVNKLGGRRQHFWMQVARSVQSPRVHLDGLAVTVSINHPSIAQKVHGGTIVPKRVSALTVPVTAEAYGRFARVFESETGKKLFLVKGGGSEGTGLLAVAEGAGIKVHYVLRKKVTQKPDAKALPAMDTGSPFTRALMQRADAYLDRMTKQGGTIP